MRADRRVFPERRLGVGFALEVEEGPDFAILVLSSGFYFHFF
jgi:hypothetical protein